MCTSKEENKIKLEQLLRKIITVKTCRLLKNWVEFLKNQRREGFELYQALCHDSTILLNMSEKAGIDISKQKNNTVYANEFL